MIIIIEKFNSDLEAIIIIAPPALHESDRELISAQLASPMAVPVLGSYKHLKPSAQAARGLGGMVANRLSLYQSHFVLPVEASLRMLELSLFPALFSVSSGEGLRGSRIVPSK